MRLVKLGLLSLMSFVLALSIAGPTSAASPKSLIVTHENEMTLQHEMMKENFEDIQSALIDLQEAVEMLSTSDPERPCGTGTERQRFVADDTEVCDNNTGLYWVKEPDPTKRQFLDARGYCENLDLGNGQRYRLAQVWELSSLMDYRQRNPALPPGNPFIFSLTDGPTWTATEIVGEDSKYWQVVLGGGSVIRLDTNPEHFHHAWCVRSDHAGNQ